MSDYTVIETWPKKPTPGPHNAQDTWTPGNAYLVDCGDHYEVRAPRANPPRTRKGETMTNSAIPKLRHRLRDVIATKTHQDLAGPSPWLDMALLLDIAEAADELMEREPDEVRYTKLRRTLKQLESAEFDYENSAAVHRGKVKTLIEATRNPNFPWTTIKRADLHDPKKIKAALSKTRGASNL